MADIDGSFVEGVCLGVIGFLILVLVLFVSCSMASDCRGRNWPITSGTSLPTRCVNLARRAKER